MNLFNPNRLITFPADDPHLVKQLQKGTKAYLAKSGDHRYADGWAFAKMVTLIIACLSCYSLALSQSQWVLYLLWYLAMIFCAMLLASMWCMTLRTMHFGVVKRPMPGLIGWLLFR